MTDININVDLGVDQALLDKLKKQRAESRQQERPFVPKTIADSSVLPNQETRAGSTDFSTNIYTSNQSLSRNRDTTGIVPVATSSFSRQTFTQAYNQAQVKTVDAQGRKRYYDPDQRIWVDEPNRLLSRKIVDNSWYLLWDYVEESHSYLKRDTLDNQYGQIAVNVPILFYGGIDRINAVIDKPLSYDELDFVSGFLPDYSSLTVVYDTFVRYKAFLPTVSRVQGRFGAFAVQEKLLYDEEGTPFSDSQYFGVAGDGYKYQITSNHFTGTWEFDIKYGTTKFLFNQVTLDVFDEASGLDLFFARIRHVDFLSEGVFNLVLDLPSGEPEIILPPPPTGEWIRWAVTATEASIFWHQNGQLVAARPNPALSLPDGSPELTLTEASLAMYVNDVTAGTNDEPEGEAATIGPMKFTPEILYNSGSYEVGPIV